MVRATVRAVADRLPWIVFACLAARLLVRASASAVDVPFWDQWDFWRPLFEGGGPGAMFRRQHGPHRQGLGGLVVWASARLSGWNVRVEVFASCAIVIAGAAIFLWSARRLRSTGRLDWRDAALPLLLLTGLHTDAVTPTPNPAHGPVPFALLCVTPAIFAIERRAARLALQVVLAVGAAYTGFTFLFAPVVLVAMAIETVRARAPGARRAHAIALGVAAAGVATFLIGYVPRPAVDCYRFPASDPEHYAPFAALVLARPLGMSGVSGLRAVAVALGALSICVAAGVATFGYMCRPEPGSSRHALARAGFLLCGFAVLFAAATAIGRVCIGLGAASVPRYAPYVMPALGVGWLLLRDRARGRWGQIACALVLAYAVAKEVRLDMHPPEDTIRLAAGKRAFAACLRAGDDAAACTRRTGFEIYPRPAKTHLEEKILFMRTNRLGPFRDR